MNNLIDSARASIAWVFPGQGVQFVGMGRDLYDRSMAARRIFDQADQIMGYALSRICFEGPAEKLDDTEVQQPAILTVSVAHLEEIKANFEQLGRLIMPKFVAGHSMGQYTAMVAAGALDFGDALRLVRERARLMKLTGDHSPGGMAALVGISPETAWEIVREASQHGVITVANANSPDQVVISGESEPLERAMAMARERGARKVVKLAIPLASHSLLMQRASAQLAEIMATFEFKDPVAPVASNIAGRLLTTAEEVRRELTEHTHLPVEWVNAVREMVEGGASTFVEIGPGRYLSGLIRRITRDVEALTASDWSPGFGVNARG